MENIQLAALGIRAREHCLWHEISLSTRLKDHFVLDIVIEIVYFKIANVFNTFLR